MLSLPRKRIARLTYLSGQKWSAQQLKLGGINEDNLSIQRRHRGPYEKGKRY
jgi:hypothetical protein